MRLGAPKFFLSATAALGVLGAALMTLIATSSPSLGPRFVEPGHVIVAIGDGRERVAIDADALVEDPDFLPSYAKRDVFFEKHARLSRVLESPEVVLYSADGTEERVRPQPRTVAMLPFVFWYQLFCGLIALLTGATVFAFRRDQPAARLYGLTGLSFAIITYTAASYSVRELTLEPRLFRILAAADHFGSMAFALFYVALVHQYPTRLSRFPLERVLGVVLGATFVLDTIGLLPSPDWGIRIPIIVGQLTGIVFGAIQWRRTQRDPVGRARVQWLLLSMLLGGSAFVVSVFVTVTLGHDPFVSQGYAFGFVLTMYLGIALGVTRYGIFQLERWWVSVWLWVVAGAAVVVVDLTLMSALQLGRATAASGSVLLVGWAYFPVRQWILARLGRRRDVDLQRLLPRIVKLGLRDVAAHDLARDWRALLKEAFDALEVTDTAEEVPDVRVAEDGLALLVPGIAGQPATRIALAHRGSRLFTPSECQTVQALVELIEHTLEQRKAYDRGAKNERERVARDLHDDIGSRLLTLVHRSEGGPAAELARDALRELRTVVSTLGAGPAPLTALVADWRNEAADRCEAAGITLAWEQHDVADEVWIDATTHTNVLRVLREVLSNALRHARPGRIEIVVSVTDGALVFDVLDDGQSPPPSSWRRGRGLSNIRQRLDALGGKHDIRAREPSGTHVTFRVPLTS